MALTGITDTSKQQQAVSKDPRYESWRRRIFGITWLAYAGLYLTRKAFSAAKVAMGPGTAIGLSKDQMVLIDTAYSVAYAIGQFVFGVAADRMGTRKIVLVGLGGSVLAALAMGVCSTPIAFALLMGIQGLCQSTGWAPLSKNLSQFFSRRERGTVMGLWCTNYAIGGWVAVNFAALMGQRYGWSYSFWVPAMTLLGIALLFAWIQRDRPEDLGLPSVAAYHGQAEDRLPEEPKSESDAGWAKSLRVLQSPMVMLLCFVYFCLKPARYLLLFWGPLYVHEKLGTNLLTSAFVGSTFELGGPVGALMAGFISDRCFRSKRVPVGVISLMAMSVMFLSLQYLPPVAWAYGAALFVIGAFMYAADSLLAGTAAIDFGTKDGASTAAGLVNGSGSIGQIIGPAIPSLIPKAWGWDGVFMILAGLVMVAALALLPRWNAMPAETLTELRR